MHYPNTSHPDHIDRWRVYLMAEAKANRTIQDRTTTMRRFERDAGVTLLEATSADIVEWLARPQASAMTKACNHSMLKMFYTWALTQGLRQDSPMVGIKAARRPRRQPRPISADQFRRLVDTAPTTSLLGMILLAGLAGLRVHEVAKFRGEQLDAEQRTIEVTGKGGHQYVLPAHADVIALARRMPVSGYWFPSQRAAHLGGREVTQRIHLHMLRQRVPGTPHCLRHHFGTELVREGADLRVVQELMRHSSLATTAIYVAVTDERKREAIDRLAIRESPQLRVVGEGE